ncbi:hypothetical protein MCBG_02484 [Micromonospora sp. M42]|nr:hypothetical protein MCBG_02484 [Micromonospora sp. M42]
MIPDRSRAPVGPPCPADRTLEGPQMPSKRKPQTETTTDEAREQMRRALQTSMDTRQ